MGEHQVNEDEDQGFVVRDRRRLDADGHERATEHEASETEPPIETLQASNADEDEIPAIDFSTFLLSLSTSAMMHLGEAPAPEGKSDKNLPMARQVIDIIEILQHKTKGNLDDDEERLIEQMLYDLRLRYVQAAG